jgi:hypothetical protein
MGSKGNYSLLKTLSACFSISVLPIIGFTALSEVCVKSYSNGTGLTFAIGVI